MLLLGAGAPGGWRIEEGRRSTGDLERNLNTVFMPMVAYHGHCRDLSPAFRRTWLTTAACLIARLACRPFQIMEANNYSNLRNYGSRSIDVLGRFELPELCTALEQSVGRRLWLRNRVRAVPHREEPSKFNSCDSYIEQQLRRTSPPRTKKYSYCFGGSCKACWH